MQDLLQIRPSTTQSEIDSLREQLQTSESRLAEAEQIIRAIRSGEVDAVVVSGPKGDQIFTLEGAEYAYRALVEEMSEGAATLAADGAVLYCNHRLSDLMHTPMEQIIGANVLKLFYGEQQEIFKALFAEACLGRAGSAELDLEARNMAIAPAHISLRAMTSVNPLTLCMVVTDLKDRIKNEELLAAGRLATTILDSAAEAIAVCDQDGIVIRFNEAFRILCNCNPMFQHFEKVMPFEEDGCKTASLPVLRALEGNVIRALEVTIRGSDSQPTHLLLSASPIRSHSTVIGCVCSMTDVTVGRHAQAVALRSEKLAAVGRLASSLAHEINNPLEALTNLLYLSRNSQELSKIHGFLDTAEIELRRMAVITSQTLRFYKQTTHPTSVSLDCLVEEIFAIFQAKIWNARIEVEHRKRASTPVLCFEGEIRQVLVNLMGNAIDAMPTGGKLLIRSRQATSWKTGRIGIMLSIADTGSGIDATAVRHIFDAFFTTKGALGNGLGLWISKEIVDRHHGTIAVRSSRCTYRNGTIFSLFLPHDAVIRFI